jgi:hypothetical protein
MSFKYSGRGHKEKLALSVSLALVEVEYILNLGDDAEF